jgi:hypothetical protein
LDEPCPQIGQRLRERRTIFDDGRLRLFPEQPELTLGGRLMLRYRRPVVERLFLTETVIGELD